MKAKAWNRELWGIEFKSKETPPMLIGGGWHEAMIRPRYPGEPSRAVLFTSRRLAREWCEAKQKTYNVNLPDWKLRVVKVLEVVGLEAE